MSEQPTIWHPEMWHDKDWSVLDYLPSQAREILKHSGSLTEALQKRFGSEDVRITVEDSRIE